MQNIAALLVFNQVHGVLLNEAFDKVVEAGEGLRLHFQLFLILNDLK